MYIALFLTLLDSVVPLSYLTFSYLHLRMVYNSRNSSEVPKYFLADVVAWQKKKTTFCSWTTYKNRSCAPPCQEMSGRDSHQGWSELGVCLWGKVAAGLCCSAEEQLANHLYNCSSKTTGDSQRACGRRHYEDTGDSPRVCCPQGSVPRPDSVGTCSHISRGLFVTDFSFLSSDSFMMDWRSSLRALHWECQDFSTIYLWVNVSNIKKCLTATSASSNVLQHIVSCCALYYCFILFLIIVYTLCFCILFFPALTYCIISHYIFIYSIYCIVCYCIISYWQVVPL